MSGTLPERDWFDKANQDLEMPISAILTTNSISRTISGLAARKNVFIRGEQGVTADAALDRADTLRNIGEALDEQVVNLRFRQFRHSC